jgi:hypothetical protein
VVEHEAKTVKRRATLALAHDVKCWNAHRKREVLQAALSYAKSQHEASRRAVDAWSCLRDGNVGSTIIPSTQTRRAPAPKAMLDLFDGDDAEATIFANSDDTEDETTIVAVEHELLKQGNDSASSTTDEGKLVQPETILPLAVASPIPEEDDDLGSSQEGGLLDPFGMGSSHLSRSATINAQPVASSQFSSQGSSGAMHSKASVESLAFGNNSFKANADGEENEVLTSSMQSLVNGLMNWGGQYDDEEDLALPTGMAASIALEESCVLGAQPTTVA